MIEALRSVAAVLLADIYWGVSLVPNEMESVELLEVQLSSLAAEPKPPGSYWGVCQ